MTVTMIDSKAQRKARPERARTWPPTTEAGDVMLRLSRAERRVEALARVVRLLCGEAATPGRRQAAELLDELEL